MEVKLTYFKHRGKYYAEGVLDLPNSMDLQAIWDEVGRLNREGGLPGLVETSTNWIISVDVPDHPHNHPRLVMPDSLDPDLLPWKDATKHPDLFWNGDIYLIAVPVNHTGDNLKRYDYCTVRVNADGEKMYFEDFYGDVFDDWDWSSVSHYVKLPENKLGPRWQDQP